jgi:hypothetical protein
LPAKGNGPAIGLFVNGTGLDPGTYEGTIVFSSDDSGNPPFEPVREVYFDHCREVFADMTLPVRVKDLPSGQAHSQELIVAPTGGTIVRDVDMIVTLGDSFGGGGPGRPFEVWLVSPNGTEALLRPEDKPFQTRPASHRESRWRGLTGSCRRALGRCESSIRHPEPGHLI